MTQQAKKKVTGYDKYVDWKLFIFPVVICIVILLMPTPKSIMDVGTEYGVGPKAVISHLTQQLFNDTPANVSQWQLLTANMMEQNMQMGAMSKARLLKRNEKWCKKIQDPRGFSQSCQGNGLCQRKLHG